MTVTALPTEDDDTIVVIDENAEQPAAAGEIEEPEASIVVIDELLGPMGPQGHQGVPGQPWVDRGTWTAGIDYPPQSIVHFQGSTYGSPDVQPAAVGFDPSLWQLWASPGAMGPQGVPGPQGPMTFGQPRFIGDGPPPAFIQDAAPNDWYLDRVSGLLYELL